MIEWLTCHFGILLKISPQTVLGSRVSSVKFSDRLVSSAAVVSGFLPASLRRMMKATMKESQTTEEGRGSTKSS